jgi:signal transduction histidine kinase
MSGTDLAGISSVARADAEALEAVNADSRSYESAGTVDESRHPANGDDQHAGYAGLPSNVIHELRTPLTSIHGYAQVLQRSLRDNPRATKALGVVLRESTRLSAMLASLSELAELQSSDVVVAPMDVEAYQLVDGVVDEVRRRDGNAHPIQVDGCGMARCTPSLLNQALLHVLTNATLFSPAETPIEVTIGRHADLLTIDVADRGIGVEPADEERIYQAFERGDNARRAAIRGLGLGLFLTRQALGLMDGRLSHRARDEGGTVFRLVVPGT